jgi:hypothetical protein
MFLGGKILRSQAEEDAFAEAAAFSMAVTKSIGALSSLAGYKGPYLARVLEDGLRDLEQTDYRTIVDERRTAFRDKVKARYIDLIAALRK